jgi:hypothetical protein
MERYAEAAPRHWNDARLLEEHKRIRNSDHLFGLAAECAIKHALARLPAFSAQGMLHPDFKLHIDVLWDKTGHQSIQKTYPALAAVLKTPNPYADWDIDQRYGGDGSISLLVMEGHRDLARRLLGAVGLSGARRP